jgi:beta-lactamase superfamily II metal-dependent hydrolase
MIRTRTFFPALVTLALVACASDGPGDAGDEPPLITISGIAEGASYDAPVTAMIAIDRGAYQAVLDGQPYSSGSTIITPGTHTLTVTAHLGAAQTVRDIHFTIRAPAGGVLLVRMLDLGANDDGGGGDAILVTDSSAAGMTHVMIDAGSAGANASNPGFVAAQLALLHVDTLALMLLTHAHGDHYGGMPAILNSVKVRRFLYNGQVRNLTSYQALLSQARQRADSVIVVTALRDYDLGLSASPAHLKFLPPLATHLATSTDDGTELNDGSVAARLQLGTFAMFFTGDGEVQATRTWRTQFASLLQGISVLKVGHHGANNAIFDNGFSGVSTWLDQLQPRISIISSNGTTHPRINAINRLIAQVNNRTYCTSVHGTITIRVTRAGDYTVSVAKNADQQCVAGSAADT